MSASPMARQVCSGAQAIPTRKVLITDPSQMPDNYSTTPGGTLYSTTPGGTRLVYDRSFMLHLKSSPLSQTPPKNIPDCLLRGSPRNTRFQPIKKSSSPVTSRSPPKVDDNQEQFDMDL